MPPRRGVRRGGREGRGRGLVSPAPVQDPIEPQSVLDQLSAEAKHFKDFRKYNHKTFDRCLEDPTKAQMWLSSVDTIFWYMKCLNNQKVQSVVFMLIDRGTTWWETTKRLLKGDVNQITWKQFKENVYAKFFSTSLRDAKRQEFLNLEPATHANALRLAVDISLHERANPSKIAGKGSTSGQKRKAEQQPIVVSTCFNCKQEGHTADRCLMRLTGIAQNHGAGAPQQGKVFATNKSKAKRAGTVVIGIDWIVANHASIDCSSKEVVFNPPIRTSFKFIGVGTVVLPKVISTMKASKLLNQGTWSILASVVDTREADVSLSSKPVVRDYPDVFLEELSGLPPHSEIDFAIKLEPNSIHNGPCRVEGVESAVTGVP
ncbi:gag-protease polyprotein [Cucumis melo var. makuwa]|uniref:Gag-protease polyprotein n=1 Tax=Cucumis melo var. makuwa TaxID=1194695 RepID=A0A5A7U803_CUCMM|nr:gag-protease polyprotein [Cucumis melo var. makuwa]TYK00678.1 gag-protease polyprotein [Cucumis melo var. makuwa]